jgi:AcrR family transcriptional regulator
LATAQSGLATETCVPTTSIAWRRRILPKIKEDSTHKKCDYLFAFVNTHDLSMSSERRISPMAVANNAQGIGAVDRNFNLKIKAALKPRKTPRQQRSSRVVDRILDAALVLTREQGATAPTTLAIAQRAGLSVGSVYQYYPNKEAILLDLARRWLSAFPPVIATRASADAPDNRDALRRDLREFIDEIAALYLDNRNLVPVLEVMMLNPDLKPVVAEYDEKIAGLYAAWLKQLNPALDAARAARIGFLFMEVGHTSLIMAVRGDRTTFDAVVNDLETMWLALLTSHLEPA